MMMLVGCKLYHVPLFSSKKQPFLNTKVHWRELTIFLAKICSFDMSAFSTGSSAGVEARFDQFRNKKAMIFFLFLFFENRKP